MNSHDPLGYAIVIAVMTVVVYLSRAGGFWLIGRVRIGPRLRRTLDALPGAIIAAPSRLCCCTAASARSARSARR
jgi:uncharacterized membrane protein